MHTHTLTHTHPCWQPNARRRTQAVRQRLRLGHGGPYNVFDARASPPDEPVKRAPRMDPRMCPRTGGYSKRPEKNIPEHGSSQKQRACVNKQRSNAYHREGSKSLEHSGNQRRIALPVEQADAEPRRHTDTHTDTDTDTHTHTHTHTHRHINHASYRLNSRMPRIRPARSRSCDAFSCAAVNHPRTPHTTTHSTLGPRRPITRCRK